MASLFFRVGLSSTLLIFITVYFCLTYLFCEGVGVVDFYVCFSAGLNTRLFGFGMNFKILHFFGRLEGILNMTDYFLWPATIQN